MRPFACLLRVLALLSATPLAAQLFMSSFSEVKYDRVKNPAVFHGGAKVDPITGSVSLDIPLGPGIGARGAEYVPTLRLRCSPQVFGNIRFDQYLPGDPSLPGIGGLWNYPPRASFVGFGNLSPIYRTPDILKGFSGGLNPGTIQINVHPSDDLLKTATIDLANGESGTALGSLPPGVDVGRLLTDFGYGAYSVSKEPGATATNRFGGEPTQTAAYLAQQRVNDFVRATTGGGILIGLKGSGYTDVTWRGLLVGYRSSPDPQQPFQYPSLEDIAFPSILLLIKGDVAYEFVLGTRYGTNLPFTAEAGIHEEAETSANVLTHAVYLVHRILNRVGDELRFEPFSIPEPYPPIISSRPPNDNVWSVFGGPGTVTWYRNGVPTGISLKGTYGITGGTPQDGLFNERVFSRAQSDQSVFRLEYQGISHSAYTITSSKWVDGPFSSTNTSNYDEMQQGASTTITQEANGETIRLLGAPGRLIPNTSTFSHNVAAQVLSEIQFPTHTLKLDWDFYEYVRGNTTAEWCGHGRSLYTYWAYGVTKVTDVDPQAPGQPRVTHYRRIVPRLPYRSDFNNLTWDDRMEWTERRQLAAVTHPDGGTTLFKYFEPPALGVNDGPGAPNDTQLLGMAALKHVVKEERHYKAGAFNFDNIEGSTPYLTVDHSALSLRHLCNSDGLAAYGNMPYAGSTVTRDLETGVVTTESKGNWDATHFGWKTQTKTVTGGGTTFDRSVQRTYEFVPAHWLGPRVTWEQAMGKAAVQRTYDDKNRVATETHNDKGAGNTAQDPALKLAFTYNTLTQAQPDRITLTSTPVLSLSGSVGAAYTYDTFGYMKTIQPFGAPGYLEQVNDAFGRATAQYDMNRQRIDIQWRTDGRLGSITPPGEVAISYTYDADARGVTIQRGAGPKSQLRYNGFGELVLERRWNGSATPSHRLSSFDTMGRKRWDALWYSSTGDESAWTLTVPPLEIPPPSGGYGRCLKWGIGASGIAECAEWEVVTTPLPPILPIAGQHYQYDHRGRLTQTLAPGNTGSTLTYTGLRKTATSGLYWNNTALVDRGSAAVSQFDSDALGRLTAVTDALNQATTYAYDDADRISQVIQQDPTNSARTQTRTWAYNTLGWPLSLTQPESGTTSYSAFDVSGKPWTTSYNGRVVNGTFDALGRASTIKAADNSVDQTFTWDTAPLNGKGKLRTATANGVTRELDYGGVGGRLSTLTRTVDGKSFVQRVTYDTYGNLSTRTYPDNKVQTLTPDLAMGLPVTSVFSGIQVMPLAVYDSFHWGLTQLYLANGASTTLTYGADQIRLGSMQHQAAGLNKTWTYAYDDANRLTSDSEDWYGYDKLDRLVRAFVRDPFDASQGTGIQGVWQTFTFDPFGNRTGLDSRTVKNWTQGAAPPAPGSESWDPTSKAKSYAFSATNAAFLKNQLPASTASGVSTGAQYDTQGNLTAIYRTPGQASEAVSLTYDALGRVKTMADASRNVLEVYTYDDEGLRIMTEIYQGSVAPQNLQKKQYRIYNEARQMVAEYELVLE